MKRVWAQFLESAFSPRRVKTTQRASCNKVKGSSHCSVMYKKASHTMRRLLNVSPTVPVVKNVLEKRSKPPVAHIESKLVLLVASAFLRLQQRIQAPRSRTELLLRVRQQRRSRFYRRLQYRLSHADIGICQGRHRYR